MSRWEPGSRTETRATCRPCRRPRSRSRRSWPLADLLRERDLERVVDQRLHALDEAHRVRQPRMSLECRFIPPPRVDEEEPRVADRAERVDAEAARLVTRRCKDVDQRLGNRGLVAVPCGGRNRR